MTRGRESGGQGHSVLLGGRRISQGVSTLFPRKTLAGPLDPRSQKKRNLALLFQAP